MAACKNQETLEDLCKCVICSNYYRNPKCLPCLHRFCTECLISQYLKAKELLTDCEKLEYKFKCSLCNKEYEHVNSEEDIRNFKDDALFAALAEEKLKGPNNIVRAMSVQKLLCCPGCNCVFKEARLLPCSNRLCKNCLQKQLTAVECSSCPSDCRKTHRFTCVVCRKVHIAPKGGITQLKIDFEMGKVVELTHSLIETDKCRKHGKNMNIVCTNDQCDLEQMCEDCFPGVHRDHNVKTFFQIFHEDVQKLIKNIVNLDKDIDSKIAELKKAKSKKNIMKKQIDRHIHDLQDKIETIRRQLNAEVESLSATEEKSIEQEVQFLVKNRGCLDEFKDDLSKAQTIPHLKPIVNRIEKVKCDLENHSFQIKTLKVEQSDIELDKVMQIKLESRKIRKIDIHGDDILLPPETRGIERMKSIHFKMFANNAVIYTNKNLDISCITFANNLICCFGNAFKRNTLSILETDRHKIKDSKNVKTMEKFHSLNMTSGEPLQDVACYGKAEKLRNQPKTQDVQVLNYEILSDVLMQISHVYKLSI